jgi:Family of unknown function (DUF6152)
MRSALAVLVVALGLHFTAGSLRAHHSFAAEFDARRPFKMSGIVTKIEWQNPHTFFYIDVDDSATGTVVNWGMEMGSPNGLMRNGWTRNTLKVGDVVSVEGSLSRDNKPIGNARVVILSATGQRLFAASSQDTSP